MKLLAVTTSTQVHAAWLLGREIAEPALRGQPRALTRTIWQLLDAAGLQPDDLDALAIDVGPGSFTGLRQGLATVRALAWALGKPVAAVGSLEAMVAQVRAETAGPVAVALPARTGLAFLGWSPHPGELRQMVLPDTQAQTFWQRAAGQTVTVAGVPLQAGPLRAALAMHALVIDSVGPQLPMAATIAALATPDRLQSALLAAPAYLAASEAEVHAGVVVEAEALHAERRQESDFL